MAATGTGAARSKVWAIKVSRASEIEDIHEDMFIDSYGDEQDNIEFLCEDSATAYDGTWLWNGDAGKSSCGRKQRSSSSAGQLVVFSSLDAANAQAEKVWVNMLRSVQDPATPLHEQLGITLPNKRQKQSRAKGAASRGADTRRLTDEQLVSSGRAATGNNGRVAWSAQVQWNDRPFSPKDPPNVVSSKLSVEVVPAQLVS